MDAVDVIDYALAAVVGTVGGIVAATVIWRRLRHSSRALRERAPDDRRRRQAPVVWERRRANRRLEDVAKGFVARIEGNRPPQRPRPTRSPASSS